MTPKPALLRPGRRVIVAVLVLIVLAALLGLDLRNRGAAWNFLWNLTGEETPLAQARGFV
jgi:hypothetical protein